VQPSTQAPIRAWAPDTLVAALCRGTAAEKKALLRAAGILDAKGNLAKRYRNWGTKVTRTPAEND
jgi:hypothetical protein